MAAFIHGSSEIQDAPSDLTLQQQQNIFLMNPNSLPYPTTRFFNPGHALLHASPSDQLLVGVPTTMDMATNVHHHHQYYNLCFGSPFNPNPTHNVNPSLGGSHGFEFLPRDTPPPPPPLAVASPGNCKRLALSLSSQQQQPPPPPATAVTEVPYLTSNEADHMEQGNSPVSSVTNGVVLGVTHTRGGGHGGGVFDPKYLKAARGLLDEIVSVGNVRNNNVNGSKDKLKMMKEPTGGGFCGGGGENGGGDHRAVGSDLSSVHKQELQIKAAKLVSMVEEVEQRYKHYRHQMQTIVSSFEHDAGYGSARPYTSVALQTISKQFRCLKDTISSQIKIISKSLGENEGKEEGSRLRLVDRSHHQLRHLGMIQHHHHNNAWRPQRGLPERAVLVLRAWLFEHFLHPYPRDSDKQMLAKQTGLTRSQVSNWFINARVRLWKPMVEEMYLEEMKDQPQTKSQNLNYEASSSNQPSNYALQEHNNNASDQCSSSNIASGGTLVSPQIKRPRMMSVQNDVVPIQLTSCSVISFDVAETNKQQVDPTAVARANVADFNGGFGNYNAAYGNCVSLSLGLPRSCDQRIGSIQFGTSNQIEFSRVSPSSTYENINISDKKRFAAAAAAAAAPLLPEFF